MKLNAEDGGNRYFIFCTNNYIGVLTTDKLFYNSEMLEKLRCWIVVHHGSMPLTARLILEHFNK